MEAGTTSTTLTARLPILNPREYDPWLMRIEQYFLMTDYFRWEVILNGNKVLKRQVGETKQEYEPTTTEEKQDRRNEMKARGTLLMELPNKDQLKFHSYKDAKLLMEAIEKRYGGNKESKKVQRTLLKQQYENFAGSSSETMDQTFDRLPKFISQLEIKGEVITQEDMNLKLLRKDLEQIDPDDLEEMDLQWEMAMLTIRARIHQEDMQEVRYGHFARECRLLRNQEKRGKENNRRTVTVETPTENALVAQDEIGGYDWSYQAEEEHPTNFALMAFTSSGSSSSLDSKSQFNLVSYKVGLESVEAKLAHYKKNEAVFEESINVLNLEVKLRDNALVENKKELEKAEKERGELKLTLEKFQNSSKSLNNLLESQVSVKFKNGLGYNAAASSDMLENQEYNKSKSDKGYHAVPPPYTGNFIPFKPDLTFMDEIVKSENMDVTTIVTPSNVKTVESNHESADVKSNVDAIEPKTVRKNSFRPPVIEDWNSNDDDDEVEFIPNVKTVRPSTEKIKFVKFARETVEKFEHLHYVCDKKVIRPLWNNSNRVNHKNFTNKITHPHPNRRFVPQAVLTRFEKINTAGASVNTAIRLVNTACSKPTMNHPRPISNAYKKGYSQVTSTFNKSSANKNSIFNKKVNTVRVKDTTARDRAVVSENKGKGANAIQVYNGLDPQKSKILLFYVQGNPQQKEYKEKGVFDNGCSRHMTGNKCYLTEYEVYDGGFVSFRDGKGRISSKRKIKSGTLVFDDVYFCKELKYNLFSVSQICDKKNNVLFTNTECLVLSSDFKLLDESQVLLRVPRKDNIYSVDLKSVVPTKGLTCLFAKTTIDESNLWHRRLGHINFKNMNKLVKGNLVRENQLDYKVKVISSDNGTEFKNSVMNQFCEMKGIKREFSGARTPQQNGVAERKNRTLIEAARTMLVDSKLPTTFRAETVNTACYVLNRVLVIKPHTKTPYELIHGRTPLINFMKPFGCPVTILNTRDHLGKFNGKASDGFFVGFLENAPNVTGNEPDWLFDVDSLSKSMNYMPVVAGNQTNGIVETRDNIVTGQAEKKTKPKQEYILIPICTTDPLISQSPKVSEEDAGAKPIEVNANGASDKDGKDDQDTRSEFERLLQQEKQTEHPNSTNSINTVITPVSTARQSFTNDAPSSPVNTARTYEEHLFKQFSPFKNAFTLLDVPNVAQMDNTRIFDGAYDDEDVGGQADLNNLETTMNVSSIPTIRINKDHPIELIIGDLHSAPLTRRMSQQNLEEHCLKVIQALEDPSWIEAMQEENLQFDLQKVWTLVDLPNGKRAIGTKWAFRNKKDERGIVVRNYDEMYVKSAFLYGIIEEEVYVCQPPGFEDPQFPDKVYKVEKALYSLHQAPRAWYETLSTYLLENGFRRGTIDKTLFIKKDKSDIMLVQVYVDDIIFGSTKKTLCLEFEQMIHKRFQMSSIWELTFFLDNKHSYEPNKALVKDEEADNMDVHLYRLMIGSLMYLTASRPNITFVVCACARFQVTPKTSHLHVVKRIFRYLKGQLKLGLWYPRNSPFDLEAFSDSDYAGASLDRKSTTGGCQFLGKRLISWQCKKQTIVANSTTKAEYVAAENCCG
ncbi:putative ribonuclease H-like domain-containing protein [Tanacetum coccineum]